MVAHVWNKQKEDYLKFSMKLDYIRDMTEAECIALGPRFFFNSREMQEGETVKDHLCEMS